MIHLLDTDICIFLINRRAGYQNVLQQLNGRQYGAVVISAITLAELQFGIAKSIKKASNRDKLTLFLARFEVVPFGDHAAAQYGKLRAHLEAKGTPIGPLDTLIATHALSLNAVLVTNNQREFIRVPKLRQENWIST